MMEAIHPGAMVECSDYPLGPVERVEGDGQGALMVRPAQADYLLKIPRSLIAESSHGRVKLRCALQEVQQFALDRPGGRSTTRVDLEAVEPSPDDDEVLGMLEAEARTYPPTG